MQRRSVRAAPQVLSGMELLDLMAAAVPTQLLRHLTFALETVVLALEVVRRFTTAVQGFRRAVQGFRRAARAVLMEAVVGHLTPLRVCLSIALEATAALALVVAGPS